MMNKLNSKCCSQCMGRKLRLCDVVKYGGCMQDLEKEMVDCSQLTLSLTLFLSTKFHLFTIENNSQPRGQVSLVSGLCHPGISFLALNRSYQFLLKKVRIY